jgi:hypothetical protein
MEKCIRCVITELRSNGVLQHWVRDSEVWQGILEPCKSCRANTTSGGGRKCKGWKLNFRDHQALVLIPSEIRGRTLQVLISGQFDVQQLSTETRKWVTQPMQEFTAALELRDSLKDTIVARQHVDLAHVGQEGPIWHLQLGGVGGGSDDQLRRAAASLRWPAQPMDFILMIELALYLFHNSVWSSLRQTSPWRNFVQETEELVLTHYFDAYQTYFNLRNGRDSWLSDQCNVMGQFNPRPAN